VRLPLSIGCISVNLWLIGVGLGATFYFYYYIRDILFFPLSLQSMSLKIWLFVIFLLSHRGCLLLLPLDWLVLFCLGQNRLTFESWIFFTVLYNSATCFNFFVRTSSN